MASLTKCYRHQVVNDLAWALSSPPLMQPDAQDSIWPSSRYFAALYVEARNWLCELDKDPSPLVDLIDAQKDRRLGKYYETLWRFWLLNQCRYEIVETNLQVIIDGETLGEMDFILFDTQSRCFVHWELAVKFYLGAGDTRLPCNWHGPAKRDRLDRKVSHLLERQSVISKRERVREWLTGRHIHIQRRVVILKGRLYYPYEPGASVLSPSWSTAEHLRGYWLDETQFQAVESKAVEFMPLINQGWLAKVSTNSKLQFCSCERIFEIVSKGGLRLPLHLQLSKPLFNMEKMFLVSNDWTEFRS